MHRPSESWSRAGWSVGGGYLWYFAGIGAYSPFATLYYRRLGVDGFEIGVLAALPAFAVALTGPIWGTIADSRSSHRLMLRTALILCTIVALLITRVSTFAPVLMLAGLLAFSQAPIAPILDGYAVTTAERTGSSYGRIRVWGSLGYTVAALAVGRLMDDRVSSLAFVAFAVCTGLGLLSLFGLPALGERSARPLLSGLGPLLRNRPYVLLLAVAYLTMSSVAVLYGFLGIHLEELGGSANLVGGAVALGAASELPVVALGGWFLSRFGASRLVALAIAVYAVRFLAYGAIPTAIWVLPIQMLHGLSYGAYLVASVTLAHRLAGREHAAGAQALLAAVTFGCGTITGSLIGGALLDRVGTDGLFLGAAAVLLVTLAVVLVALRMGSTGWRESEETTHPAIVVQSDEAMA